MLYSMVARSLSRKILPFGYRDLDCFHLRVLFPHGATFRLSRMQV